MPVCMSMKVTKTMSFKVKIHFTMSCRYLKIISNNYKEMSKSKNLGQDTVYLHLLNISSTNVHNASNICDLATDVKGERLKIHRKCVPDVSIR